MNCSMNMKKGCVCEEAASKEQQPVFTKIDCCKQITKEINNSSNFQNLTTEVKIDFIVALLLPVYFNSTSTISYNIPFQNINFSPPRDIPVLNSTFRI